MTYARFFLAICPDQGSNLARFSRQWTGWDVEKAQHRVMPRLENLLRPLPDLSAHLYRKGLHMRLTPRRTLPEGAGPLDLHHTLQALAPHLPALECPGLSLRAIDGRLWICPVGQRDALTRIRSIAQAIFQNIAPPSPGGLARRRSELTEHQLRMVLSPPARPETRVSDLAFQLTTQLGLTEAVALRKALLPLLSPALPTPFRLSAFCLCGEDTEGAMRILQRYRLGTPGSDKRAAQQQIAVSLPPVSMPG